MTEKTLSELREEIIALAEEGLQASSRKDLAKSAECAAKACPLMREYAERTGDKEWADFAAKGEELHRRAGLEIGDGNVVSSTRH